MLNIIQVWNQIRNLPDFKKLQLSDLKPATYGQVLTPSNDGTPTPFDARTFPNGSVVVGVDASCVIQSAGPGGQSANNRQLFGLDFQYTGGEAMVIDGPISAEALLRQGWPTKPLIVSPTQQLKARASNLLGGSADGMIVHIAWHTLIYRFAG